MAGWKNLTLSSEGTELLGNILAERRGYWTFVSME